jgi:hypothetical protein
MVSVPSSEHGNNPRGVIVLAPYSAARARAFELEALGEFGIPRGVGKLKTKLFRMARGYCLELFQMTRRTNATIAGFTYLLYIAVAFPAMVLFGKATSGGSIASRLASIAQHSTSLRLTLLLGLASCFCALVLAVTLYGITHDEDRELAILGFACRVGEGLVAAVPFTTLGLIWLAKSTGPTAPDVASASALAAFLLNVGNWQTLTAALLFAVGSTLFSYLLLRGRMIPVALAWLGVVGSTLLVVILPLQLAGFVTGPITQFAWIPVAAFEITLAFWLIVKGVAAPAGNHHA